jgi:ubiquinone/menaquinone biosynthesis C-methylase UbiE
MTGDAEIAMAAGEPDRDVGMTHWDRIAETTSWGRYLTAVEQDVILRGTSLVGEPGSAIDMGCGSGRWSKLLSDRGWNLTCTDVSEHALSICRRNVPTAKCILTTPRDQVVPAEANSAELVLCIEVVPLIEGDWFLREAHRVLKERGLLIGVYINGRSWRALAWRLKQWLTHGCVSNQFYNAPYSDWKRRLLGSGLTMVHEESCCWGPFSRDSNSPFVPACAKVERALRLHRLVSWSPWVVFIAQKT